MVKGIKKFFGISELRTTIPREILAGAVTFFSMVYILAVQPNVIAGPMGMDPARVLTATAISAGIATLVMAFLGKLPIALAPGMGTNFFLAFAVCVGMGFSWQTAIAAVFVEGVLCIILTLTKIR
jgi:AGZA family xanthine/uracil permease-like MFS transporter